MSFLSQPFSFFPVMPQRKIDSIDVNVILQESTSDQLTITKQPVQQGAMITDHAFKEPTTLSMQVLQSYNTSVSLSKVWQQFLDLQNSRVLFTVVTPKRIYSNQLLAGINVVTDKHSEACLQLNLSFQEVLIVRTSTTTVPRAKQGNAGKTGKTENAGKRSVLKQGVDSIAALRGPTA